MQRTFRPSSRLFFDVGPRDVLFHQYDLNHGVQLNKGKRISAIFWLSDSREACIAGSSDWYEPAAHRGSAFAQDALMELHAMGQHGYAKDFKAAVKWGSLAAEQGYAPAQV